MKRMLKRVISSVLTTIVITTAPLVPTTLAAHSLSAEDYTPYPYQVPEVFVSFMKLDPDETLVYHRMDVLPSGFSEPLELKGKELELLFIHLDDVPLLEGKDYQIEGETLTIFTPPSDTPFQVAVGTKISPREKQVTIRSLHVRRNTRYTMRIRGIPTHHLRTRSSRCHEPLHGTHQL